MVSPKQNEHPGPGLSCKCCGKHPCEDCPPFIGDLNFSVSDDLGGWIEANNYDRMTGPSGQTCSDTGDGYRVAGSGNGNAIYYVLLRREYLDDGQGGLVCGWILTCAYNTQENATDPSGFPNVCDFSGSAEQEITALDPRGTYTFTVTGRCLGLSYEGMPFEEQRTFNFTVTIS